jgi:hypothetical protein
MSILDYIPYGEENAISREDLKQITGLTDRQMRKKIEIARETTPILNFQGGKGYFIPTETEQHLVIRWIRQEVSRRRKIEIGILGAVKFLKAV